MYKDARKTLELIAKYGSLSVPILELLLKFESVDIPGTIEYLYQRGYIEIEPNYAISNNRAKEDFNMIGTPFVITAEGKAALEESYQSAKYRKFNEIRSWITLAIAFAALVVSVIALLK